MQSPLTVFSKLLVWLDKPVNAIDLQIKIDQFYNSEYVHWDAQKAELADFYQDILPFYLDIKHRAAQQQSDIVV